MKPSINSSLCEDKFFCRLLLVSAVELALICIYSLAVHLTANDTVSYFEAFDTLLTGQPDYLRTPVYPFIIGSLRFVFGETGGLIALYLLQSVLFLWSVKWMKELTYALVSNHRIARWAVAIYAVYPGPLTLCGIALTEAFALSGIVAVLLLTWRAFTRRSVRDVVWSAVLVAVLILLRPALIYLPVALLVFWIISWALGKADIRTRLVGIIGMLGVAGLLICYCGMMFNYYGFRSPSFVGCTNNYFTLREAGLVNPADMPTPDMRAMADSLVAVNGEVPEYTAIWDELFAIMEVSRPAEFMQYCVDAIRNHPAAVAKYIVQKRMADVASSDCVYGGSVCPPVRALTKIISVNSGAALLMLIILMVMLAVNDVRHKHFSMFMWFLCGLMIVAYASVTVGAMGEWPRLLIPNYPVLLILGASFLQRVTNLASCRQE